MIWIFWGPTAVFRFMLEGDNAAELSNLIGAGNPNATAQALIRPDIAADPAIFPTGAEVKGLEMLRDHAAHDRRVLSRMWTEVKVT